MYNDIKNDLKQSNSKQTALRRMTMKSFSMENETLRGQFKNIEWIENSGVSHDEINAFFTELMKEDGKESRAVLKAKLFAYICENSRIAIDKDDIFQDKLYAAEFLDHQRYNCWRSDIEKRFLQKELDRLHIGSKIYAYRAEADFGHTSPNSRLLLELGFSGLLAHIPIQSNSNINIVIAISKYRIAVLVG